MISNLNKVIACQEQKFSKDAASTDLNYEEVPL